MSALARALAFGSFVFALQSTSIGSSNQTATLVIDLHPMRQGDVWGYADSTGRVVIKPQFSVAHPFSEGLALVWTGGVPITDSFVKSFVKMGFIDQTGRWKIRSRLWYYFYDDFSEGLTPFRKNLSGWGYIDRAGKTAIRPHFQWAGPFTEGSAPVMTEGLCARIDKHGTLLNRSQTTLPRNRAIQNRHGIYVFRPNSPPCS